MNYLETVDTEYYQQFVLCCKSRR